MTLTRLWPDGIAARIALTLILGVMAAQAISALAYWIERPEFERPFRPHELIEQIVRMVRLMEAVPPSERTALAAAGETRGVRLSWQETRPDLPQPFSGPPFERLRRHLRGALGTPDRDILIGREGSPPERGEPSAGPGSGAGPGGGPGPRRGLFGVWVAVPVGGGGWLVAAVPDPAAPPSGLLRFGLWIGLTTVAVVGLSLWAARRITGPLARFAEAAERLGVDAAAAPLPEQGPRELRAATGAVNRMQARLQRFVEDRTRMLAAISHDLRTPLTRLRLRAEFVDDPDQQRKLLADLDEMETMISATLAFARDDAEREARTAIDLADLLQSLCESRIDAGQDVAYHGPPHLPHPCRPVAIRRALNNLVDNAVKYGGNARIHLDGAPDHLTITVADDGPGIPEAEQERVFAPFYRLESSRSRDTGGTGLGLGVARSIVRGHGGDLVLENRPEGGLRAVVTLPR